MLAVGRPSPTEVAVCGDHAFLRRPAVGWSRSVGRAARPGIAKKCERASNQVWVPAELKHINKRRKRN
jgi:hypothetical protein